MAVDDRELLWLAYPDGYLPVAGVFTMGGWRCVGVVKAGDRDPDPGTLWLRPGIQPPPAYRSGHMWPVAHLMPGGPPHERRHQIRDAEGWSQSVQVAADLGELLPSVDRHDPGTWGAALHDLAAARLAVASPAERLPVPPGAADGWWGDDWCVSGWHASIPGWVLRLSWGVTGVAQSLLCPHVSQTLGPELALVEARARLRTEAWAQP
jgi:hypothetical protein